MGDATRPAVDLGRLAPALQHTCAEYCGRYRAQLEGAVRQGQGGVAVAAQHARILDGLLGALHCAAEAFLRPSSADHRVALVAVGGYGRGTVGLHSDADVLLLTTDPEHGARLAEGLLYPLWDIGLPVGHSVRTPEQTLALAEEDVATATTLLDLRRVAGDRSLVDDLRGAARRRLFAPESGLVRFLEALEVSRARRHERFGGSLFLLEPEVKLGCGGLRDLDVTLWAGQARWGTARSAERRDGLQELVEAGVLLPRELDELTVAREMLWRVRNLLHLKAGRRQDRLTFEDQEEVAQQLGFVEGITMAVEQFMQAYYRHARIVEQSADRLLDRARRVSRHHRGGSSAGRRTAHGRIGPGVLAHDGHITLEDSKQLATDPGLALRFYAAVAAHDLPPYPFARDAIARAAAEPDFAEKLRASDEAAPLFLSALVSTLRPPVHRRSMLAELHDVGLLLALIPEFGPVTGRVQHDVYHVYTVDVHSVAAVDQLRAIKRGDHADTLPFATTLAAELPRPEPLFLALLLHDIGKAHGNDHSHRGASIAGPIARRLGLSEGQAAHVEWLVAEHLSLYHWATRRDTSDPAVLAEVARRVETPERLRDLFLLTVADVSTTHPDAMTAWKGRMLEDLYAGVSEVFEGQAVPRGRRLEEIHAAIRRGLGPDAVAAVEALVESLPDRYLLSNSPAAIQQHARVAAGRVGQGPHIEVADGPSDEESTLLLFDRDRPGLLAAAAAVLAAHRLNVVSAQIYTRRGPAGPEAFDVFHVRRATAGAAGPVVDDARRQRILHDLGELLSGEVTADELLARRIRVPSWARKHSPSVPTQILIDNEASARFTVVDVFTRDRPALLHTIARCLHERSLTIGLSKVNTEGDRAADVFYVQDEQGRKVQSVEELEALQRALEGALAALSAGGPEARR
jgi:[protein-PII] uridylyltransferase